MGLTDEFDRYGRGSAGGSEEKAGCGRCERYHEDAVNEEGVQLPAGDTYRHPCTGNTGVRDGQDTVERTLKRQLDEAHEAE